MRNGADFSVFVNTGQEFDGSDSGARYGATLQAVSESDSTPLDITHKAQSGRSDIVGKDSPVSSPRQGVCRGHYCVPAHRRGDVLPRVRATKERIGKVDALSHNGSLAGTETPGLAMLLLQCFRTFPARAPRWGMWRRGSSRCARTVFVSERRRREGCLY